MKTIKVTYGCGFGRHHDSFEVDDDATEEEIEQMAQDIALEHFDWSFTVEDE